MARQSPPEFGEVSLDSLDNLWFQVAGTICNLTCTHCFISCAPDNDKFSFMTLAQVKPYLDEAVTLGVKEFYFTGGEPFLNPDMFDILRETLAIGPATVLTNGTIITDRRAARLRQLAEASPYSLELRVSLDGFDASSNDAIRGDGSFDRAVKGIRRLVEAGFLPIITAVQTWDDAEHPGVLDGFKETMRSIGYDRPRLKIMPALDLGAYKRNRLGGEVSDYVTEEMLRGFDTGQLICANSRLVAHDGVYVCPILLDSPAARMGQSLSETTGAFKLRHTACYTCYQWGAICSNFAPSRSER